MTKVLLQTDRAFNGHEVKFLQNRELGTWLTRLREGILFKVARYHFSGPLPPKFEHKLRGHKQSFGEIATPVVLCTYQCKPRGGGGGVLARGGDLTNFKIF